MTKNKRFGNVDPADGLANPNPETDVTHDGQSLAMPGVKQFYLLDDGSLAGQFHPEIAGGQMPKAPGMYTLKVENITYHPATGIECWDKPIPWVFLTPIKPKTEPGAESEIEPDAEPDMPSPIEDE